MTILATCQMEEMDGVAEYRDRLLALPCLKETSYPRSLPFYEFYNYDIIMISYDDNVIMIEI